MSGGDATRRGFLGAAAALGAAKVLSGRTTDASADASGACTPTPPGVRTDHLALSPDGRTVWTADTASTTITPHRGRVLSPGQPIDVGGAPLAIAIAPDGRTALVTTAHYDRPGLAIVDLITGEVDRVDVGPEPYAVAYDRTGRSAWVAGGGLDGTLTRVDPSSGRVHAPIPLGRHPRGLAIHPDGVRALVALNGDACVALVSLRHRSVRRVATRPFPYLLAIAPDGDRALVTHNGFKDRALTPIDLRRRRAGRPVTVGTDPAGVAFTPSGRHAVVATTGARAVMLVDARTGARRRTYKQLGAPRSVAVSGTRAIVLDGTSGELRSLRLGARR